MSFLGIAAIILATIFLFGTRAGRQTLGFFVAVACVIAFVLLLSAEGQREKNAREDAQRQQVEQQELAAAEHTRCDTPGLPPNYAKYAVHCNPALDPH